jgi:glycosyltransferase involved in cell wall biosynthesis
VPTDRPAPGLTVCLIVRDERANLENVLPVLVAGADDVVVVDTGSADGSAEVARDLGARVFHHPWNEHFAEARNRGLDEVRTSHVLWLDADDRITAADLARVRMEALAAGNAGLMLTLVAESPNPDFTSTCAQLRVFPAHPEHRFAGRVHEQIRPALERTGTPVATLDVTVRHLGYESEAAVLAKSRRNLRLCRREREDGNRGAAATWQYVQAATLCGEHAEAAAAARETCGAPPPDAPEDILQSLRVTAGRCEHRLGRVPRAEATYRDAVTRHPQDPWARWHLGELLALTGRTEEAVPHLEVAATAPPLGDRVPIPLAGLRRAAGDLLERCRAGTPA